ncbi:hypothetical protein [Mycoplasma leonicaptivi]|nr:hypothetical protein [Mycoplasma leonicaptivi]
MYFTKKEFRFTIDLDNVKNEHTKRWLKEYRSLEKEKIFFDEFNQKI